MTDFSLSRSAGLPAVIATTSLGFVLVQLDVSIVNLALVRIGENLGAEVGALQWVVDAYALSFASFLLLAGTLGDRLGARRIFGIGLVIFTCASLACGLSRSIALLVAARTVQGLGAALLMPASLALLNHACGDDREMRARAIGLWTAAGGLALSAGPVIGGFMVDRLGWQSLFLANLPLGAVGIWLASQFVDETECRQLRGRFDWQGQILACVALFAFTGSLIEAGTIGFWIPLVLAGLWLALASFFGLLVVEASSVAPMLPLRLFDNPRFSVSILVGFAVNLTVYGVIFVLGFYFQRALHYSPAATGLAFLPFLGLVTVTNVAAGSIAARYGARLAMLVGLLIGALGFALLTGIDDQTSYASLIWRLLFIPLGIGLAVPPMTSTLLGSVERAQSGIASGILNTVRQAAGAIGVAVFGALIANGIIPGMRIAFLISTALLCTAAGAVAMGIRKEE
jgi:DHA2 family methylenomycin A resistance protein-like MFS transporter